MSAVDEQQRIPSFTVGDRLRKAREKAGLDQEQFAHEIGVSRGTVSNYERADSVADLKKPFLMAWAMRTDVPFDWLVSGKVLIPQGSGPDGTNLSRTTDQYAYSAA